MTKTLEIYAAPPSFRSMRLRKLNFRAKSNSSPSLIWPAIGRTSLIWAENSIYQLRHISWVLGRSANFTKSMEVGPADGTEFHIDNVLFGCRGRLA